jgi:hypothetical protein
LYVVSHTAERWIAHNNSMARVCRTYTHVAGTSN